MPRPPFLRSLALYPAIVCALLAALSRLTPAAAAPTSVPVAVCARCHQAAVASYQRHGMARSLGKTGIVPPASVINPVNHNRYTLSGTGRNAALNATFADGGTRRQRIVGRIGGGIFATSWVGAEVEPASGMVMGRLFFAPVETIAGTGAAIAPFDLHPGSPSLDQSLTQSCITCHTTDRPERAQFPPNLLGADAFDRLSPITCSGCHGDIEKHVGIMTGSARAASGEIGLARLGKLSPGVQRDICARCHLQGDVRIELTREAPHRDAPLAGQIPVLVPARQPADFRFVGQLERLALSACFKKSPAMTCTTCHVPHQGVSAQGPARFDAACAGCHAVAPTHTTSSVVEVAGQPARTRTGCVDCHVRRSAPFDLPKVRSADHFIQRRIAPPRRDVSPRQFADREGPLVLFDDGRLGPALLTPGGQRWQSGVLAMGLLTMGRIEEAARHFEKFPSPGSPQARRASAPAGVSSLETEASFHTARALTLMATGRFDAALAAFGDALSIDPVHAEARLGRARLSLDLGDIRVALLDTQAVIDAYSEAEQPWDLRVDIAQRGGRPALALSALETSTRLWPANPRTWLMLSDMLRARGDMSRADQTRARVRALRPSLLK